MRGPELWREFDHDPRAPELRAMRASDADRDIVLGALAEAYAEGRIDREEYDERADTVHHAKTLGELPVVLEDLVPSSALAATSRHGALDTRSIEEQAVARWEKSRRDSVMGFLVPTVICWLVWALTMPGGFAWPLFVMIPTAIPVIRATVQKKDIVESNKRLIIRRQEKEARKELHRRRQRGELPPAP